MKSLLLAAVCAVATASVANAATYEFDYSFGSGSVLEGFLEGTLQGDNDTIHIDDFGAVSLDGVFLSDIEPSDVASISDFRANALQPLVSISGAVMDVFVCPQGFTSNNCNFASEGGFYFETSGRFQGVLAGDGQSNTTTSDGTFSASNWNIQPVSAQVPLPATLPMAVLALGAFGVVGAKRRRNAA